jgi:hypothetical protein
MIVLKLDQTLMHQHIHYLKYANYITHWRTMMKCNLKSCGTIILNKKVLLKINVFQMFICIGLWI